MSDFSVDALDHALVHMDPGTDPMAQLQALVHRGLDRLPLPGQGATLLRWRALARVGANDLSLAKLYEGHTDALAILSELGRPDVHRPGRVWGVWAAEAADARVLVTRCEGDPCTVSGAKAWCSGAEGVTHGLLTAWHAKGRGPWLAAIDMAQPGVETRRGPWRAVGMAGTSTCDVQLEGARAELIGSAGDYLSRPGFWHGGAGIAACWYGAATAIAGRLRLAVATSSERHGVLGCVALGQVELQLQQTLAVLTRAAHTIDAHPEADAQAIALVARLSAERCATQVLGLVGSALGAGPYCRDARFARLAADLPVFLRQSHAERDFAALGECVANADAGDARWAL